MVWIDMGTEESSHEAAKNFVQNLNKEAKICIIPQIGEEAGGVSCH